jgi:hypothetical protein
METLGEIIMNKEYNKIINEINKIHMKRRILNIQERLLHKKIEFLERK